MMRRKINDCHNACAPHSAGHTRDCLPSPPHTSLFPFCTQYTLNSLNSVSKPEQPLQLMEASVV